MPADKTPIHVSHEHNEAIKMLKFVNKFKSADEVVELLLENFQPDLIERARQIIKLKKGGTE